MEAKIKPQDLRIGNIIDLPEHAYEDGTVTVEYGIVTSITNKRVHWKAQCIYDGMFKHSASSYDEIEGVPLNEDIMVRLGAKKIPHFTVTNSYHIDLGRNRKLSIGDVGNPNLMVWLVSVDEEDPKKVTDLICIHNWDYDKELYVHKLQNIVKDLSGTELTLNP